MGLLVTPEASLQTLSDVQETTPATGDVLTYESGGYWSGRSIASVLGYTPEHALTFTSPLSRASDTISFSTRAANTVLAGPMTGADAAPAFRALVAADIPQLSHSSLSGLTSGDDHTQYALLAGRSGGQTLIGGTASGNNLTLQSTSHATKGKLVFGTSAYDEVNNRLGIANAAPTYPLDVTGNMRVQSGVLGIGVAPVANYSIRVNKTETANATSYGIYSQAFVDTTAQAQTNSIVGIYGYAEQNTGTNTTGNLMGVIGAGVLSVSGAAVTNLYGGYFSSTVSNGTVTSVYGVRVISPTITGTGAIGAAYGLYISNQAVTGVTTAYALYTAGGNVLFTGAARVGINVTPNSSYHLYINETVTDNTTRYGVYSTIYCSTSAQNQTNDIIGIRGEGRHSAGTGTVSNLYGLVAYSLQTVAGTVSNAVAGHFRVQNTTAAGVITLAYGIQIGATVNTGGGSIGTNYGLRVETQAGIGTTNYGIYLATQYSASGANYSIYSGGGEVRFDAGNAGVTVLRLRAAASPTSEVFRIEDSAASAKIYVASNLNFVCTTSILSSVFADTSTGGTNARMQTASTGITIDRNVNDANTVLIVKNIHASATGDYLSIQNSGGSTLLRVITGGHLQFADAVNLILGTTTGTKIGTATTQKIGFYNATPIVQQTVTGSRATGAALTDLLTKLASLGLIVDSSSV